MNAIPGEERPIRRVQPPTAQEPGTRNVRVAAFLFRSRDCQLTPRGGIEFFEFASADTCVQWARRLFALE
jgi:hypothetical protein